MVKPSKRKGFTLIEVVTTVFIIGLLVLLVLPNVNHVRAFAERSNKQRWYKLSKHKLTYIVMKTAVRLQA